MYSTEVIKVSLPFIKLSPTVERKEKTKELDSETERGNSQGSQTDRYITNS